MIRILVTGGAGFVGSHLCERLLGDGHQVVCVDDLSTGAVQNVAHLTANPAFELVVHDVSQPFHFEVDGIFNLASPASPVHYQLDPVRTVRTNVNGAINVLELARRLGAPVVQASTSEVYGDPRVHPQHERYWGNVNPVGVRACYNEAKRCAETLMFDYQRQYEVDVRVARIFNTYGPRMRVDDGRVVSQFIIEALRGHPITVHGDGRQTRSFCFVDDLVEAMVLLMGAAGRFPGPVNVGSPRELPIRRLVEMVIALTGSTSRVEYQTRRLDDPSRRCPDISLARRELGWEPSVSLEDGLNQTIAFFRDRVSTSIPRG